MSKVERLNARVEKLLCKAVQDVLDAVKETVLEYQEKTARTLRENQSLKRRLQEIRDTLKMESSEISQQADSEPYRGGEKQKEDTGLVPADEDMTVICPSYSFEFLDCEASIPSLTNPCPSPKATTGLGVDDVNSTKTLKMEADVSSVSEHVENATTVTISETDHKMKVETTSHQDPTSDTSYFYGEAGPSSASIEHHPADSGLDSQSIVFSLNQNDTEFQSSNNTNDKQLDKVHVPPTNTKARGRKRRGSRKQYHCSVCGRTFKQSGDFKKHNRVHTGEKPYCCPVCGKRFSQSGYLTVHLRFHTGEKPFCCSYCGKSFSHSSNMRKHEQIHM